MLTKQTLLAFVGALALAAAKTTTEKTPTQAEIDAARDTVLPYSPVSNVKGLAFDRFVNIWLENTDYETAASDENLSKLAKEGILLTNYFAVTHPSEPNYCASAGGDTFGMDNDDFLQIPANVSTIADLFDTKHIAWGEYQEDMPYAGYQGMRYPLSGPNQYVRKHNPLVLYDSVTDDAVRPRQIKNFTTFYEDLKHHSLPQFVSTQYTMLSRAVLPLTRPNVFASAVRASTLSARPSPYTAYKLSPAIQLRAKSNKSKSNTPKAAPNDFTAEQPEFDTKAESTQPSESVEQEQAPQTPLPDLTQGIPSTLAAELEGRMKKGPLNLTEDPAQSEEYGADGRGGGDIPKGGYETSIDRRKARMANIVYAAMLLAGVAGMGYLGRNWDTEEEASQHPEIPSGWSPGLWYSRIKARTSDLTSYYKDPAFPKLLPDEDAEMRQPYTLVLSLEDLLVHSEWTREHGWRVAKRPGVDYFLRYLNQYYELVLFTSVPSMMADQVLRKLDPYRIIRWPLFREATRYKDGEYIKDLQYLNRDLSKVILIDTKEEHARYQPENAIVLDKWTGDPKDKTLVALIPFLEYLAGMGVEDVRTVLKSFDGTPIPVEFAKREKAMRERFEKDLAEEQKKKPSRGLGNFAAALGLKSSATLNGEQSPSEGLAQGKMLWDQIRERGQKNYEMIESEIRANGEKWLAEMAAEEEKARQEQMQSMKGSFTGIFGAGSKDQ